MTPKIAAAVALLSTALGLASCATPDYELVGPRKVRVVPSAIPVDRSGLAPLTAELRAKTSRLGLDGLKGLGGDEVSRALVLLPKNRARPGVITFEIEDGPDAGAYQCETLGRGKTSAAWVRGWVRGAIGRARIYYAPMDVEDGATVPGLYDVRNISTDTYEIELLNASAGPDDAPPRARSVDPASRPHYSGVWKTWYSSTNDSVPIDMLWSEEYQPLSQGAKVPVFERPSEAKTDDEKRRREKQLSRNKDYYRGPYGRCGFANHTDQWDDPARKSDSEYAGRDELVDFRWRNTDGCLKVRPDCLLLLNEFVAEQTRKNRRVQYDVRETRDLDRVPVGAR
jgi:hypothetical protein